MKQLYLSYLPPIFFRVAEKCSFVPRLAAFFHAHARCSECFSESPYIPPFIAPFLIHVSTILSMNELKDCFRFYGEGRLYTTVYVEVIS